DLPRVTPFLFFQAEDGIRDGHVTGVQTCALPISGGARPEPPRSRAPCRPAPRGDPPPSPRRPPAPPRAPGRTRRARPRRSPRGRSEERRVGKEWRARGAAEREQQEEIDEGREWGV